MSKSSKENSELAQRDCVGLAVEKIKVKAFPSPSSRTGTGRCTCATRRSSGAVERVAFQHWSYTHNTNISSRGILRTTPRNQQSRRELSLRIYLYHWQKHSIARLPDWLVLLLSPSNHVFGQCRLKWRILRDFKLQPLFGVFISILRDFRVQSRSGCGWRSSCNKSSRIKSLSGLRLMSLKN